MSAFTFTAYCTPQPQGSSKAFVISGRAHITSANTKLKPFRSEVTRCALHEMALRGLPAPVFGKHVPVRISVLFTLRRPDSVPKKRVHPVVKPDCDKLLRSLFDSMSGCVYHDDAQVCDIVTTKVYGPVEGVQITAEEMV